MRIIEASEETSQRIAEAMRELYRQAYRKAARVIVAGGRDFDDYALMEKELDRLFWGENFCGDGQIKILSGMAPGADTLAIRYADEHELTKILFPANWKYHHRMAGFLRNKDMVALATHLVAFWDGRSHGTKHIIDLARAKGIPCQVIAYQR